jgi:hypothetical protein
MRFITLDVNNTVTSIRDADKIVSGEIQSEVGELGQIMKSDGSFITPAREVVIVETTEQKIERLEQQVQQDNLILFDVLATIYEELLASKGSV